MSNPLHYGAGPETLMMPGATARDAWLRACAKARGRLAASVLHLFAALSLGAIAVLPSAASAEAVRGEASLSKPGEYARLVIKLQSVVDADIRMAGTILIIHFRKPVDVTVDKLADALPDYIGMARIDPDGTAIRLALVRKVTPNVMAAGERLFIDLLPESWKGDRKSVV